jgi:hypothetical protein
MEPKLDETVYCDTRISKEQRAKIRHWKLTVKHAPNAPNSWAPKVQQRAKRNRRYLHEPSSIVRVLLIRQKDGYYNGLATTTPPRPSFPPRPRHSLFLDLWAGVVCSVRVQWFCLVHFAHPLSNSRILLQSGRGTRAAWKDPFRESEDVEFGVCGKTECRTWCKGPCQQTKEQWWSRSRSTMPCWTRV